MSDDTFRLKRRWPRGWLLVALTLLSLSLWWLVKTPPVTGQAKAPERPAAGAKPFHQRHVQEEKIVCTACHETAQTPKPGHEVSFSVRPGHAECVSCHEDDFKKEKVTAASTGTVLCKTCHTGKGDAVGPFPSGNLTLTRFSHAAHVDPRPKLSKSLGVRQDCAFCHKVEATAARPARASHPECATCHSGSNSANPVLVKVDVVVRCLTCHTLDRIDRNMTVKTVAANSAGGADSRPEAKPHPSTNPHAGIYAASAAPHPYRDLRPFNHGSHIKRRDGAPIDCTVCHTPVLESRAVEAAPSLPTMRECATCHNNATFVRADHLIKNCEVCHTVMRSDLRPRPSDPVSPTLVHTEGFRAFHGPQAKDANAQCGVCHTGVVNVSQNSCAGCHSAMQPRSHASLRFAEWEHGRLAALDRKTCTTCHTGDFCVACHSVVPRSHVPLQTFVPGGHRQLATLNLRSCSTCHTFEVTCARCHRKQLR